MRIEIVVFDGFDDLDAFAPNEVLHHAALDELAASGALVRPGERVVDDGDLVTAGGITSGIDLALHLVARELGADAARDVAALMEYEPQVDLGAARAVPAAGASPG